MKAYLKRMTIPAALILASVTAALAPTTSVSRPADTVTVVSHLANDDTPWG